MTIATIDPHRLGRRILSIAMQFNNLREIVSNKDWDNPATPGKDRELVGKLYAMLRATGWQDGWAYCAAFVDAVVCEALRQEGATSDQVRLFTKPMQLGVMNSVRAFKEAGLSQSFPGKEPGTIWLARHGSTDQGHCGFVIAFESQSLSTIEANTSKDAKSADAQREGDWITTRVFSAAGRGTLRTQCFVTPTHICQLINK